MASACAANLAFFAIAGITAALEANPPDFGENVIVLEPGEVTSALQSTLMHIYDTGHDWSNPSQFGNQRTALLLKPGEHSLDFPLPYYFSVVGLGEQPSETVVNPGPRKEGLHVDLQGNEHSLKTFWRSIENLRMTAPQVNWWVSQAAPLRSVIVDGDLYLSGAAPASGGCIANSQLNGKLITGTQQQWYTRSTSMAPYYNPAKTGSFVCVGCTDHGQQDQPFRQEYSWKTSGQWKHHGLSYIDPPEVFAEKPYITFEQEKYYLRIPAVNHGRWGPDWQPGSRVDFMYVFVVRENTTASEINAKISSGRHIVFPPGIYHLERPIEIHRSGTVLLGLGYATLVPSFGPQPLISVGNADDVRIAGLILQAGPAHLGSEALLRWGEQASVYGGQPLRPGVMHDLFFRVGGPDFEPAGAKYMLEINNGWVIGDNLWLWGADHCVKDFGLCCAIPSRVDTALRVNGPNVHMYGLAAEHTDGDIVQWHGPSGRVYYLQSEFRYSKPTSAGPDGFSEAAAFRFAAEDFRGVAIDIYVVMVWACRDGQGVLSPLSMKGGFKAFVIDNEDVWKYGLKDVNAINFDPSWPVNSKMTCLMWHHGSQECLQSLYETTWIDLSSTDVGFQKALQIPALGAGVISTLVGVLALARRSYKSSQSELHSLLPPSTPEVSVEMGDTIE